MRFLQQCTFLIQGQFWLDQVRASLRATFGCHLKGLYSPRLSDRKRTATCTVPPTRLVKLFAGAYAGLRLPEKVQPSSDCRPTSQELKATLLSSARVWEIFGVWTWTTHGGTAFLAGDGPSICVLFHCLLCSIQLALWGTWMCVFVSQSADHAFCGRCRA